MSREPKLRKSEINTLNLYLSGEWTLLKVHRFISFQVSSMLAIVFSRKINFSSGKGDERRHVKTYVVFF